MVNTPLSSIVLGMTDLQRAINFYTHGMELLLGYHTDHVAFFDLPNLHLVLFNKESLSSEAHIALAVAGTPPISLVHQVESRAAVEAVVERALASGASLARPPSDTCYGGYSGYFSDPEGFLW
jgi:uncharacterized glyoxalase superfamily protein PhnB